MGWLDPVSDLLKRIPQQVGTFAGKAADLGGKVAGAIPGLAQGEPQAQGAVPLAQPERALPQLSQKKSVAMGQKVLDAFSGIGKVLYGEEAWKGMSKGEKAMTATIALGQGFRTFANAHWGDARGGGALMGPSALESLRGQTAQWEQDDPERRRNAYLEQRLADPNLPEWDRQVLTQWQNDLPMIPENPAERRREAKDWAWQKEGWIRDRPAKPSTKRETKDVHIGGGLWQDYAKEPGADWEKEGEPYRKREQRRTGEVTPTQGMRGEEARRERQRFMDMPEEQRLIWVARNQEKWGRMGRDFLGERDDERSQWDSTERKYEDMMTAPSPGEEEEPEGFKLPSWMKFGKGEEEGATPPQKPTKGQRATDRQGRTIEFDGENWRVVE